MKTLIKHIKRIKHIKTHLSLPHGHVVVRLVLDKVIFISQLVQIPDDVGTRRQDEVDRCSGRRVQERLLQDLQ